jgi:anti-anti-sigma regulatory factor
MQSGINMVLRERGFLIVAIRSPHSDDELADLCARVIHEVKEHRHVAVILDLGGLDVLDAFSLRTLTGLCQALRLSGAAAVITGMPPDVAVSLAVRGLGLGDVPVAADLSDALATLQKPGARGSLDLR